MPKALSFKPPPSLILFVISVLLKLLLLNLKTKDLLKINTIYFIILKGVVMAIVKCLLISLPRPLTSRYLF